MFPLHNQLLKIVFLQRVCDVHERKLPHHVAKKKIPFFDFVTRK